MRPRILSVAEAVAWIPDKATVFLGGGGAGHAVPDELMRGLGERFQKEGRPEGLTVLHPCGIGNNADRGLSHIAFPGLIKRAVGGFWGNSPKMVKLALEDQVEGYNLPQGVLAHLVRACAAGEPGIITRTGLRTFADPRLEGGKLNASAREDLVQVVELDGHELLYYKAPARVDIALIRGTSADCEGNLTLEEEVGTFSMLSMAQAAKTSGGKVIAQVKRIHQDRHFDPVNVVVPGAFVDALVLAQVDQHGNINSSRFGSRLTGCGGAIDISQHAQKVVFCGSLAVKAQGTVEHGQLELQERGKLKKFVSKVDQVTFSGSYSREKGQEILYVTERAVFRLASGGLLLIEIAPGVDLARDVLEMMDFKPVVPETVKLMPANYDFSMRAPVMIGNTITASAEVIEKREDKPIVTLRIRGLKQDGRVCVEGKALIYMISDKHS